MRNFFGVFFIGILLAACSTDVVLEKDSNHVFLLSNQYWNVFLPNGWEVLQTPSNKNKAFLLHSGSQNLAIVGGYSDQEDFTASKVFANANQHLISMNIISESSDIFNFQARENKAMPLREFYQKVILEEKNFILASCSYDIGGEKNECLEIIESIHRRKVDKSQ